MAARCLKEENLGSTSRCEMLHCKGNTGSVEPVLLCSLLSLHRGVGSCTRTAYACSSRCHYLNQHVQGCSRENSSL